MTARWMIEISEEQARKIALQTLAFPEEETDRVREVSQGGTEDERYRHVYVPHDYDPCDHCWIVVLAPLEQRGYSADGPEYFIWIDQRTGNVVKIGEGSGIY